MDESVREQAAKAALQDIKWLLQSTDDGEPDGKPQDTYLDGPKVAELLEKNFQRLDPNDDGISRRELMAALVAPDQFTDDEYEMLRLVVRYFDTIVNMADDEDGEEIRISRMDMAVLKEFLVHGQMTLKDLKRWSGSIEQDVGPPPLSGS